MTKVLVTGGAGFIGSHIVDILVENNVETIIVDNLSSGTLNNLSDNKLIRFYNRDIVTDNYEDVFASERPDYVVHLAAQTSVTVSTKHPVEDANANIIASIKLLNLCKKYGVKKFLTASTAAVYGMPQYLPVDENHPTIPISHYGLSKLTMEKYVQLSEVPYVILRFANVYGPRQASSKESGVVAIFNNAMSENKPISIFGDGEQIRDFVFVKDIANIVYELMKSDVLNEVINYSTNTGVTINELFDLMKDLYGYKQVPQYFEPRIGDIKDSILANKKIGEIISNNKITDLKEGLALLQEWNSNEQNSGGAHALH